MVRDVALRRSMLRAALMGLAMGAAWGVAARVFMRLVSTDPDFSWAGTGFILGLSAVWGCGVALAAEAHQQGRRRWWYLVLLPGMLLFAGQGMPFLPAFILGSVALARWRGAVGLSVAAVAAVAPAVLVWWSERFNEESMVSAPLSQQLWLLVGLPALGLWLAYYGSALWAPKEVRRQSDSPDLARSSRRSDSSLEAPAGPA